ncbi:alpha/beta fold hydrolase [Actinomadura verrucosospora]|uniref:Carboxymuconolactone decarboxylase n=1 Tax=Actinomadura verrucosospora TaxID=46165 RepID=A0A7D3ZL60_ACTVE|nr:alpha/beta fold hydrolase [Actinomadura verrucosospora]QKG21223.1 Carboxymuconolactone decarboxylase [Actinomadura verrucosospora]
MKRDERGRRAYEGLMGVQAEDAFADVRRISPQMYETVLDGAFGGPLARAELTRREREIASTAIVAAIGGADRRLASHVRGALHQGVAPHELLALAEHVAVYAGFPRALNALDVVHEVLQKAGVPDQPALHRVQLSDHETVVAQKGDHGPAVILSHSLGVDWRMWEPVMERLAHGRRVFAYDFRGHGGAAGAPRPFSMDDLARDMGGVLDAFGVEQAHVVGLSMGGGIAQTFAVRSPERVASLALLATTDHAFDAFEGRARSGEVDGMEAQIVPTLTRWFTAPALAVNGWGVQYARELVRRFDPADWAAAWRAFKGVDVQGRLAELEAPTLVLVGEEDYSTTPEVMSGIAERIPGSTYQVLPGTPHMQTLEKPELVADALDRFLPADR